MITLIRLRIKEQFSFVLPMVLVLLGAVLFGSISSIALSDRQPLFRVALFDEDGGYEAVVMTGLLYEMPGLELVIVDSLVTGESLIDRRDVEALIIINEDFSRALTDGVSGAVAILPAPGSLSSDIITEAVSLSILRITALDMLRNELAALDASLPEGLEDIHSEFAIENPVLTVAYEGPDTLPIGVPIPAKHGIQALFLLLSALHAAFILPGISGITSATAKLKNFAATLVTLLIVWTTQLVIYLLTMSLFFGELPNISDAIGLFSLIFFNISLGAVFSVFCIRKELAAYLFIPYFLLNMTLGGGLWGRFAEFGRAFDVLLPVSGALRGEAVASLLIFFAALLMLCITLFRMRHRGKAQNNG